MIDKEGVRSLSEYELVEALGDRGLSVDESISNSRISLNNHLSLTKEMRKYCLQGNINLNTMDKGAILSAMMITYALRA